MNLTLKDLTRHINSEPGDHLVAAIQQLGDDKTTTDTTDIIVDTSPDHRDIRIADGKTVVKIRLAQDYTIHEILQDNVRLTSVQEDQG